MPEIRSARNSNRLFMQKLNGGEIEIGLINMHSMRATTIVVSSSDLAVLTDTVINPQPIKESVKALDADELNSIRSMIAERAELAKIINPPSRNYLTSQDQITLNYPRNLPVRVVEVGNVVSNSVNSFNGVVTELDIKGERIQVRNLVIGTYAWFHIDELTIIAARVTA